MKNRTGVDFSKHEHRIEIFKNEKGEKIRVDHFQEGNRRNGYIKFVNDSEGMTVFGDYGNWVFCRPFHPSPKGYVSDHYWCEKLSIASSQEYSNYDAKETEKELKRMINGGLEEWGYKEKNLEKAKEWFTELLNYVDDELEYTYEAFRGENPTDIDYDYIPFVKEGSYQLKIIFDAFDEICKRLKEKL